MPLSSATPYVHQAVPRRQPRAFRAQSPGCSHRDAGIVIFDRIWQKRMPLRPACHRPSRDFFCSTEQEELLVEATDRRLPAKPAGISPPPRTDPAATTFTSELSRQGSGWEPPDALDRSPHVLPLLLPGKMLSRPLGVKAFLYARVIEKRAVRTGRNCLEGQSGPVLKKETSRTDTNVASHTWGSPLPDLGSGTGLPGLGSGTDFCGSGEAGGEASH